MCIFPDQIIIIMAHWPKFPYMARSLRLQLEPTQVVNAVATANKHDSESDVFALTCMLHVHTKFVQVKQTQRAMLH